MEVVVIAEGELIWLATGHREHVKMIVLVRGAGGRGVDHPLALRRNVRPCPIEALFVQDDAAPHHGVRLKRNAPQIPRAQRHIAIRYQQQLAPILEPGGLDVDIPVAEVRARSPEVVIAR